MYDLETKLKEFFKDKEINNVGDILSAASHPRDMVDLLNLISESIGFNHDWRSQIDRWVC